MISIYIVLTKFHVDISCVSELCSGQEMRTDGLTDKAANIYDLPSGSIKHIRSLITIYHIAFILYMLIGTGKDMTPIDLVFTIDQSSQWSLL